MTPTIFAFKQEVFTGVRWVDPVGIHLTLKFLSNLQSSLTEGVFGRLLNGAFQLSLSQLGVFPMPSRTRVLWAGIKEGLTILAELQARAERAFGQIGFAPKQRPYSPHLTLGRVREGVQTPVRLQIGRTNSEGGWCLPNRGRWILCT